jgi:hypothetical protein
MEKVFLKRDLKQFYEVNTLQESEIIEIIVVYPFLLMGLVFLILFLFFQEEKIIQRN